MRERPAPSTLPRTPLAPRAQDAPAAISAFVENDTVRRMAHERRWALQLDPEHMQGVSVEIRMLRQSLRDAFVRGNDGAVRQHAEALRRLLRERAVVPEVEDADGPDAGLEDGLSADLRRVLQRVGVDMGIDA